MIAIIIVDYNTLAKTIMYMRHCLEYITDSEKVMFVVVDNGTLESSLASLQEKGIRVSLNKRIFNKTVFNGIFYEHEIVYVKTNENMGYARGNNLGVTIANEMYDVEYIIFSNNDLHFTRKFKVNEFIKIFKDKKDVAALGPKIITKRGVNQSPCKAVGIWKKMFFHFHNILLLHKLDRWIDDLDYTNESKYTYRLMGCFLMVDKNKFIQAEMFDESTFLYAEEMILSERFLKIGYRNYFYNELCIIHEHGFSTSKTIPRLDILDFHYKSNAYYYQHYMRINGLILLVIRVHYKIFKMIFRTLYSMKCFFNQINKGLRNDKTKKH